jgi:cysteine desulfurase
MSAYFDYNATCPLDERVLEAMLPYLHEQFGNPSSMHHWGKAARTALDTAREQVAALAGAHPTQLIFTSGGTEANNLALKGYAARQETGRIAVSSIEHASVMEAAASLQWHGWSVDRIAVDDQGRISEQALQQVLQPETRLVSIMLANNETGVIQGLSALAQLLAEHHVVLHSDAVQAAGKMELDFANTGAAMMTLSAHKIYGPKGVGALVMDKALDIEPLLHGGGHEKGLRSGTENVAGIVGFGKAAELAMQELSRREQHMRNLRDSMETALRNIDGLHVFAADAARLANTSFVAVPGIDGETLLMNMDLDGIGIASGSACSSEDPDASHVLLAMGVDKEIARSAVRISLGKDTTMTDVEELVQAMHRQVNNLRSMASGVLAR